MKKFQYDVVLSFAGENREYVKKVAVLLQSMNVSVFYDKFEAANLLGKELEPFLHDVYRNKARYCVIFVSQFYGLKKWTQWELKAAKERADLESKEYILPVRFDRTTLSGLQESTGYLSTTEYSPGDVVDILLQKLGRERTAIKDRAILQFRPDHSINFKLLLESLDKFKKWDIVNISQKLPVNIILPFNISQRIDSYRSIVEFLKPSERIPQRTIDMVQEIYSESYLDRFLLSGMKKFSRKLYSLYLQEIISVDEFEKIINTYCKAKMVNYIRKILVSRLVNTEDEPWLVNYYDLTGVWGSDLMNGLPYVVKKEFDKPNLVWIQIDLVNRSRSLVNHQYYRKRFYIPDTWIDNTRRVVNIERFRNEVLLFLVPQIFEYNLESNRTLPLWEFIKYMDNYELDIRGEWFYRVDNFSHVGQNWEIEKLKTDLNTIEIDSELKNILEIIFS